jgi:hypothetical protein
MGGQMPVTTRQAPRLLLASRLTVIALAVLAVLLGAVGLALYVLTRQNRAENGAEIIVNQSRPVSARHEAPAADNDPTELVLTGAKAKTAARQYLPWFLVSFTLITATLISGWLLWHRSPQQLTFLGIGVAALIVAGLIWHTGIFSLSYEKSSDDATFTSSRSPVPPGIAVPVLAASGIFMILAATSTGIGSALTPVAAGGIVVWQFGQAAWGLLVTIIIVGFAIAALFSRDDRAIGGCVLAFFALALLVSYVLVRFTGTLGRQEWDSFVQPFRDIWRLVGG